MVFHIKNKLEIFKIPKQDGVPGVYFGKLALCGHLLRAANKFTDTADYLGTQNAKISNPISGSWFRMEKGPESTPPMYEYDEVGVVLEGRKYQYQWSKR
jgi:hypothetical protein